MMQTKNNLSKFSLELAELPQTIISIDGQSVASKNDIWVLRANEDAGKLLEIDWNLLQARTSFSERAERLIKQYIAHRIPIRKAHTVHNDFSSLLAFGKWLQHSNIQDFAWKDFSETEARSYLSHCMNTTTVRDLHFIRIRTFYEWGESQQFPDFSLEILQILKSIKTVGNLQGQTVRSRDERKGPLTPDEKYLILEALKQEDVDDKTRIILRLNLELGARPIQIVRLKNSDFISLKEKNKVYYQLDVPRAKQRTIKRLVKRRPLSTRLGQLIESTLKGSDSDPLLYWLNQNSPEDDINLILRKFADQQAIYSPRTDEIINLSARRFRYTLGTHLKEEGAPDYIVAEILDHNDLSHVNVYSETVSSIADQVEKAIESAFVPIVKRFQGKIIDSEKEASPNAQTIPALHAFFPNLNIGGVGACARNTSIAGLCSLLPPLSCYLCSSFEAYRNGPHQEMLNSINNLLVELKDKVDTRIVKQLEDVRLAIMENLSPAANRKNSLE